MSVRIKLLSECLLAFLTTIVQFLLLPVFLPLCTGHKKKVAPVPTGPAVSAVPVADTASKNINIQAPLQQKKVEPAVPVVPQSPLPNVTLKSRKEPEKMRQKAKEPEVKPMEKKEVKKSIKVPKIEKSKEKSMIEDLVKAKDEDKEEKEEEEPVFKLNEKEELEPKTDLDSHREEDKDDAMLSGKKKKKKKNKNKEKLQKTNSKEEEPIVEKAESSGYVY